MSIGEATIQPRRKALCFEDQHSFTGVLQKYGYDVERHNHSAILSGLTEHVTRAILDRKVEIIYADFYLAFNRQKETVPTGTASLSGQGSANRVQSRSYCLARTDQNGSKQK